MEVTLDARAPETLTFVVVWPSGLRETVREAAPPHPKDACEIVDLLTEYMEQIVP
jgi:hypothetical protein